MKGSVTASSSFSSVRMPSRRAFVAYETRSSIMCAGVSSSNAKALRTVAETPRISLSG